MGIIFLTMALRKPVSNLTKLLLYKKILLYKKTLIVQNIQDIYWAILLCLSMFGFFGLGAFPIILELAVIPIFVSIISPIIFPIILELARASR